MQPGWRRLFVGAAACLMTVVSGLPVPGYALNDLYWDTNGTTDGTGAVAGTWGVSNFWSTDPAGLTDTFQINTTALNDLHFSAGTNGANGTVTVSGAQFANGIYFEEGTVTLSGGTSITLSDGATINNATAPMIPRISTALVATGTVTLTGARIWLDNPSFAGGGTLNVNTSNATLLENGGALNGLSVINVNSGGLDIRQSEGGYNYAAGTTTNFINSASLTSNMSQSATWLGNITIASTRTATLGAVNAAATLTYTGNISGAGGVNITGPGITHYTGTNTYTGTTTVNAGILRLGSGGAIGDTSLVAMTTGTSTTNTLEVQTSETIGALSGGTTTHSTVNLASGQTLTLASGTQTYSGLFSGAGTLAVAGATQTIANAVALGEVQVSSGTLVLSSANDITNGVSISGGTVRLLNATAAGNAAIQASGGTIQAGVARGSSLTVANAIIVSAGSRVTLSPQVNGGTTGVSTINFTGTLTVNAGGILTLGSPATNAAYGTAFGGVVFGANSTSGTKFQVNGTSATLTGLATNGASPGSAIVENGSTTAATVTVALPASAATVYAGTLRNGGTGALALVVNGGTGSSLTLAGANIHTGSTTVTAGSLVLAHSQALQNSTLATGGAGIVFDSSVASHAFRLGGLSGSAGLALQDNASNAVTLTVGGNNTTQTYSGALTGTGGLTKAGTALLSLNGTNTYTGATTVTGGELRLDFGTGSAPITNILSSSSALVLSGGHLSLRQVLDNVDNGQTFSGWTLRSGSSILNVVRVGGGEMTLTLGALTREAGSTFAASANGSGNLVGIFATGTNTASGIIGGYATFLNTNGGATLTNATDWAIYSGGKILPLAAGGYSNTAATTAATNLDLTANVTLNANATVGSVRFNNATPTPTLTLNGTHTVGSGGILVTPAVGANATRITGGRLTSGNGQDLIIIQNNTNAAGALTVDATLTGAVGLTKSGGGQLILAGTNDHTGATYLNGGVTSISSNANLGSVSTGAAVHLNGGTLSASASVALDNAGANARDVVLGSNGGTLDVASGQTMTVSGALNGEGNLAKTGSGALVLTGSSTQTGTTTVSAGLVQVSGQTGPGSLTLNGASAVLAGSGTVGGATTVTNGVIRPGDASGSTVGTLTVGDLIFTPASSSTVVEFQITGSTGAGTLASDKLVINGSLTLNSNSNLEVDGSSYTPTLGDSFVLLDWSTVLDPGLSSTFNTGAAYRTGANIGNEGNLDLPDLSSFGLGWDILNFSGSGSLTIVVVPEPGRMLLVFLGLTALGWRRRRR